MLGNAQYPPGWFSDSIHIYGPSEYVFGVADGSVSPQQFTFIKAKLQYYLADPVLGAGNVMAAATYRKRTDYQPDLSADPPTAASVDEKYSLSVSLPVPVDTLPSFVSVPVTFDFSADPIPAGITDLELRVFFIGSLDPDVNQKVFLSGYRNLNEPMHLTYWDLMDHLLIYDQLMTIDEIYSTFTAEDWQQLETDCGITDLYISLHGHFYVGFGPVGSSEVTPVAYMEHLLPGQHSRLIVLTASTQFMSRTYIKPDGISGDYYDWKANHQTEWEQYYGDFTDPTWSFVDNVHTWVVNSNTTEGFVSTDPMTFRTLKTHFADYYFLSCPTTYTRNEINAFYQNLPPDNSAPVPFSVLTSP